MQIKTHYISPKYHPMTLDECIRKYLQTVCDSICQNRMVLLQDSDSSNWQWNSLLGSLFSSEAWFLAKTVGWEFRNFYPEESETIWDIFAHPICKNFHLSILKLSLLTFYGWTFPEQGHPVSIYRTLFHLQVFGLFLSPVPPVGDKREVTHNWKKEKKVKYYRCKRFHVIIWKINWSGSNFY